MVCGPTRYVIASINVGPSPAWARATASFVTRYTASTSLPSTRTPGNPKPSARFQISPVVCDVVGTLIAQPLFWQNRIAGERNTAAMFAASWKSPSLAEPSPK